MPRLKLTLAYQGTHYAGWQLQSVKRSGHPPTVQGELERCLQNITGGRLPVHASGRTDAGVHAEAQVCHVDVPQDKKRVDWLAALNTQLPQDIRVTNAEWVPDSFHARKSAKRKRYAYSVWMHRHRAAPRIREFVWSTPVLDFSLMDELRPLLVGRRDFATFQNSGTPQEHTVRTLFSLERAQGLVAGMTCPAHWPVATFYFEGDGFLKQMVRNIMGLLVWTGQGKIRVQDIPAMIAAKERRALPSPSAPAQGLTLMEVLY